MEPTNHSHPVWCICTYKRTKNTTDWYETWQIDMARDLLIWPVTRWYVIWCICTYKMTKNTTDWYETWLVDMARDWSICYMTHWLMTCLVDVWHVSLICDMMHSYVVQARKCNQHDSLICGMSHPYLTRLVDIWHDAFICGAQRNATELLLRVWSRIVTLICAGP